jgi:multidrug resistance efflux pump
MEESTKKSITSEPWFKTVSGVVVIGTILGVFTFWVATRNRVQIDNSYIDAPLISLSPTMPGTLQAVYVKVGDTVEPNTQVAKVGDEIINAKVHGVIATVSHQEGQLFTPGTPVVSMVNTREEKVVGKIDEDKGLKDIKVGQVATFTVDAFGSKQYKGIVEEVSPISNQNAIVFSISDKREIKQFNIKVAFNIQDYPELKNGMSAKLTIYTR